MSMATENLLLELLVEELPPKALRNLGRAFAAALADSLKAQGLAAADAVVIDYASPRRLAVHISEVYAQAAQKPKKVKLMPLTVGMNSDGGPTPALVKKMNALGLDHILNLPTVFTERISIENDGKVDILYYTDTASGPMLFEGLQKALADAIAKLPIPKVMQYQLARDCELPGWSTVSFVRPAHGLVALHGSTVVPVTTLGLQAGNSTQGHRFEARVSPVVIAHADAYEQTLGEDGSVIASFENRSRVMVHALRKEALRLGCRLEVEVPNLTDAEAEEVLLDNALMQEVTGLVERPTVMACSFDAEFLEVPQECLILTMKANQKYFPLLDAAGKLSNRFLIVSNINPADTSAVVGGNERVVRPRLADAQFFFNQDRKRTLESRVDGLSKVVYHNQLGTQGERVQRVCAIAGGIATALAANGVQPYAQEPGAFVAHAVRAARLAKTDLVTDMVGEFPELQGTMGRYYALNDGEDVLVAEAIEDHYKPRFAGDSLPRSDVGLVVALADKLETLVGMFGIGNLPTGDKDPFALRRHALGVIRMLVEKDLPLPLAHLLRDANPAFGTLVTDATVALADFMYDRLSGSLREQGYSAQEVDAVLALRPERLGEVPKRLAAVRAFAALPESPPLAAANKRIANILKKADDVDAHVSPVLLQEDAEKALHAAMQTVLPKAQALFEAGDYTASLQALAVLRAPVDAFFDGVMVNAEQPDVRLNRLGLLKTLHLAMNRVADLSKLAA